MIDESLAQELQSRYLQGQRGAMAGLYAECRHITEILARSYIGRHEKSGDGLEDTIQIILSRVLGRYRKPGYVIHSFSKVLNIEVVHELSNHKGPKAQWLQSVVTLEGLPEPAAQEDRPVSQEDHRAYFNDIYTEIDGPRIILRLSSSRTYRGAILYTESIMGRRWVYDHAKALRYVWRHMRKGRKK